VKHHPGKRGTRGPRGVAGVGSSKSTPSPQKHGRAVAGRKTGTAKARAQMLQHDKATQRRGSMAYGKGVKPPKTASGRGKSRLTFDTPL
jgi:hypothetical protein